MKWQEIERQAAEAFRAWRSFEPYPQLIAPIVAVFEGPSLPFMVTAERLLRLCA